MLEKNSNNFRSFFFLIWGIVGVVVLISALKMLSHEPYGRKMMQKGYPQPYQMMEKNKDSQLPKY